MSTSSISSFAVISGVLVASLALGGCAQPQAAPPASAAPTVLSAPPPPYPPPPPPPSSVSTSTASAPLPPGHPGGASHVYRFDFVLTAKEGNAGTPGTSFTLNIEENHAGEVLVGKNVPLSPPSATATGPVMSARQDVGLKVKVHYRTIGEEVLLDVSTEMSAFEPPSTVRKVTAIGNALAAPGKPTMIVSLDDDKKHYELTVTPTKLR